MADVPSSQLDTPVSNAPRSDSKHTVLVLVIGVVIGVVLGLGGWTGFHQWDRIAGNNSYDDQTHQEDVHIHADILLHFDGSTIDLSQEKYQSDSYEYLDPHIHMHDGNGEVLHIHRSGVTLRDYLQALKFQVDEGCVILAEGDEYCQDSSNTFVVLVNDQEMTESWLDYQVQDLDQILIWYGSNQSTAYKELSNQLSDRACIYSQTCPERGTPPEEQCIAGIGEVCGE